MWPMGTASCGLTRMQAPPHGARDFAMQRRDGVGAARELEAQHGHAEGFVVVGWLHAAKAHQIIVRDAELVAQGSEMLFDEIGTEAVVAGGHGCVRGEDDLARNHAAPR